jgi:hypothetical protein
MSTPLDQAQGKQAELAAKLAASKDRLAKLKSQKDDLAYATFTGDPDAAKSSAYLAKEIAATQETIDGLTAACDTAALHVAAAEAAERDADERNKASQALALIEDFKRRGAKLDAAFASALAEYAALERDRRALDLLGFPPTTPALCQLHMKLAATTALQSIGLQVDRYLSPGQRRNFATAIEGWASGVERRAQARLAADAVKETPKARPRVKEQAA